MSVQFEENDFNRRDFNAESTPKFAGWLISHGVAKDVSSANKVLVIGAIVCIALALFIAFR